MKKALVCGLPCFSIISFALFVWYNSPVPYEIDIINDTGCQLRIDKLVDICGNVYVNETHPLYLKPEENICFTNLLPVIHLYTICANKTCEVSAVGIGLNKRTYEVRAILEGSNVCVVLKPNIWPGNTI